MSVLSGEVASCGDIYLWERYTNKKAKPDGSLDLSVVEGGMPDGLPCSATIAPGWKPREAMQTWYNYVMGEIRARETSETPKNDEPAQASGVGGSEASAAATVDGGGGALPPPAVQDSEETVESVLEAKIAAFGRLIAEYEAKVANAAAELSIVQAKLSNLNVQRAKAIAALKMTKGVPNERRKKGQ